MRQLQVKSITNTLVETTVPHQFDPDEKAKIGDEFFLVTVVGPTSFNIGRQPSSNPSVVEFGRCKKVNNVEMFLTEEEEQERILARQEWSSRKKYDRKTTQEILQEINNLSNVDKNKLFALMAAEYIKEHPKVALQLGIDGEKEV